MRMQRNHEHLERGCRHRSADLTQQTGGGEAARHRSLNMCLHGQVSITVDAEVADERHGENA